MEVIRKLVLILAVFLFTVVQVNAANVVMYNPPKPSFTIRYTPGSGVYPNVKKVMVKGFSNPAVNRVQENRTPCGTNGSVPPPRPVYPYYGGAVKTMGAVFVGSSNRTANNDYYYGRYNPGYGNRIYVNNSGNGNVYIRQ